MVNERYSRSTSAHPIAPAAPMSRQAMRRRVVLAATIGNTLEWYDFLAYASLSVTMAKVFFPTGTGLALRSMHDRFREPLV